MDAADINNQLARIAAAIAEPARAKILCALMDGRARTSTELSVIAEVSPSTTSAHLHKLSEQGLVVVLSQGKHRYYQLADTLVANAIESLMVVANTTRPGFQPSTPNHLQLARTCYDHMAGSIAVLLHDYLLEHKYLQVIDSSKFYALTEHGKHSLQALGIDLDSANNSRRQFACTCLDWSERRHHVGGALGAALLKCFEKQQWVEKNLDNRALKITAKGQRQFLRHFNITIN
ncbi:MAG: helix-turn-helix domain-containing protein [Rheinheimera sp.]|nr:helix-turn-helix domain-containing protein [Rheinheimera sp.]